MNAKQKKVLEKLAIAMFDLAEETGKDDNFNEKCGDLGIFKMSIDDSALKIYDTISE